ncbi:Serine/threonine kinase [Spraguea lophii 42_110]|uniref:Serine/threonine kinase n=1 Tax=Spraguea lophii (strain 42_110) TaxID=1358809 RepID=S7WDT0_SPRLO|nr:Serine/threonine kinase [Spraguea lophii 42_110]
MLSLILLDSFVYCAVSRLELDERDQIYKQYVSDSDENNRKSFLFGFLKRCSPEYRYERIKGQNKYDTIKSKLKGFFHFKFKCTNCKFERKNDSYKKYFKKGGTQIRRHRSLSSLCLCLEPESNSPLLHEEMALSDPANWHASNRDMGARPKDPKKHKDFDSAAILKKLKKKGKQKDESPKEHAKKLKVLEPLFSKNEAMFYYELNKHFKCKGNIGSGFQRIAYFFEHAKDKKIKFAFVCELLDSENSETSYIKNTQQICDIIKANRHHNIMELYAYVICPDHAITISEFIAGKTLGEMFSESIHVWSDDLKKNIVMQLLDGLEHLHILGIVHLDLHFANIMLDKDFGVKIIDFGMSKLLDFNSKMIIRKRTLLQCSPEVMDGKPVGFDADIWSFAVIFYILFEERPPYTTEDILNYLRNGEITKINFQNKDPNFKDLMEKLLALDKKERICEPMRCYGEIRLHLFFY